MRKLFLSTTLIMFVLFGFSQTETEQMIKDYMAEEGGYSWSTTRSANLSEGESASYSRTFYEGTSYIVIAFSENNDVRDTDVYLYGDEGEVLRKSTTSEDYDMFEFEPNYTQEMKLLIKNYDSYSSTREYKCKLMVFYR